MKDPRKIFRTVIYTCGMLVGVAYFFLQQTAIDFFLCLPIALFGSAAAANYLEYKMEKNIWMAWVIYNACAIFTFICLGNEFSLLTNFLMYWLPISIALFIPIFVAKRQINWDEEEEEE